MVFCQIFYEEFEKPLIKHFGLDLRKILIIFLKKSTKMTNKHIIIFQTAVKKYVDMHETS